MRSQRGSSSHYLDNIPQGRATIKKKERERESGIKILAKESDGSGAFYEGEDIGGRVRPESAPLK